jgi:hypothetical protein
MRSHCGGQAKNKVQPVISTDVIISAATVRHLPPSSGIPSPAIRLLVPGACNSASLWIEHPEAYMQACSQVKLGVSCLWRVYWRACLGVYLRASGEHTWEHIVKQDGSVASSGIGSKFESILRSVLESVLRAYLEAYSQAGWECHQVQLGVCLKACLGVCLRAA